MNDLSLAENFVSSYLSKTKLNNIGSRFPFTILQSITSHFEWILAIVLEFKFLSSVKTPGLSECTALVVLKIPK